MKMPKERSAGVVVLKWSPAGWKYLTLVTSMIDARGKRRLDFPKGHIEKGEDWIDAAIRETLEEAGIPESSLSFTWGDRHKDCFRQGKVCRMFIASTDQKPKILRNPESHRFEHVGWQWLNLSGDAAEDQIHPYIRPAVEWARSIVAGRGVDSHHVNLLQPGSDQEES